MIAPHELKNKTFTRAVRGYNPVEVDEYFDFLIEKYTEAYRAASEFEQKFNKIQSKYAELSNEEESIRSAILKAQKLGEAIINNAKKDAAEKEAQMKLRCEKILEDTKNQVEAEKEKITLLRKMAADFQRKLYDDYMKHVEMIRDMSLSDSVNVDDALEEEMQKVKEGVSDAKNNNE